MPQPNVCPVFVGRDAELSSLIEALHEGGTVLVVGEAGIGKSRLAREFADFARAQGHHAVWGRPEVVGEAGPYSLIVDLLESVAQAMADRAAECLELGAALGSPHATSDGPPAKQIAARVRGLLEHGRRMVAIAEDLHAADEPSQAVLAHLARSASDDGLLLVGTLRPEAEHSAGTARLLDLLIRDRLASRIDLEPLATEEQVGMLEAMWGKKPSADEVVAVLRLAGGVPFYVEELAAGGQLGSAIPESVSLGLQARLQRLTPRAKQALEVAALSTGVVDPCVLARALAIDEDALPEYLIEGVRVGLLADRDGRLEFRHSLLREAMASRVVSVERRRLHGRIAKAIETCHRDDLETHALALAHHHREAGDELGASRCHLMAGHRALRMSALDEAHEQFEAARELAGHDVVVGLACAGLSDVEARRQRLGEAIGLQRTALTFLEKGNVQLEMASARTRLAELLLFNGDPSALEVAAGVHQTVALSKTRVAALRVQGRAEREFGSHRLALETLVRALAEAEELGDIADQIECCLDLAVLHGSLGDSVQASAYLERAMSGAVAHSQAPLIGRAFSEDARRLYYIGQYRDALNRLEVAREHLLTGLSSHLILGLDTLRALVLWRMGRPTEADRVAARLESGLYGRGYGRVIRVWAAIERGEQSSAVQSLNAWWERVGGEFRDSPVDELQDAPDTPEAGGYAVLADAVLAAYVEKPSPDDIARAYRYWQFCRKWPIEDVRSYSAALAGLALVRSGDIDRALEIVEEAEQGHVGPHSRALYYEIRGEAAALEGDKEKAQRRLSEAADLLSVLENCSDRARVLLRLCALRGDQDKGVLREALRVADEGGAVRYVRQAEASLRAIGVRPRAGRPRGSARTEGLSAREEEVVTLVASGATNAEIAQKLFLSARTVEDHIARAGRRIGVSGRAGLAAWAAKQGLI